MKVNLEFYKEDIFYNKLDTEDLIIDKYFNNYNQDDINELLNNTQEVDNLLAFSSIRNNIINWYPFKEQASILEIGAGLGQITGELCKKAKRVVSVEFSQARGQAIAKRYENKENLEVIIGNLKDISFNEKFDYITLIGVLEYAPEIYKTEKPFLDLLNYVKSLLSENGKILVATDNKFAMRNWAVTEINEKNLGYNAVCSNKSLDKSQILSKNKIEALFRETGLNNTKFYYPLPDYKFTNVIFTDDFLPDKTNLHRNMSLFYDDEIINFHENDGYLQLIKEEKNLFKMYANSFFIEVGKDNIEENNIKYVSYWNNRNDEYKLKTIIQGDKVYKYPVNNLAKKHLNQIKHNIDIMRNCQIKTLDSYDEEKIISNYQENYKSYNELIIESFMQNGIEGVIQSINAFRIKILEKLEKTDIENNVFDKYQIHYEKDLLQGLNFVKHGMWDLNFQNCLLINDELFMYDQEWLEENMPIEFILYRAILIFNELNRLIDREKLFEKLDLIKYKTIFNKLEEKISSEIISKHIMSIWNRPVKNVRGIYIEGEKNKYENEQLKKENKKNKRIIDDNEQIILMKNKEIEILIKQKTDLQNELNHIINSKSWTMTKPLRKIRGIFK